MKKKLYVSHPGHFDGQKELVSEAGKDIYSIFMAGSPDYRGNGRSNLSSPQIEDSREQTAYAHTNGVAGEIVLNSLCLGGRQLTPTETHAAQDGLARSQSRCGTAGGVGLTRSGGWARMCRRSIIDDGEFWGCMRGEGKSRRW